MHCLRSTIEHLHYFIVNPYHKDSTKFHVDCRRSNSTLSFYMRLIPAMHGKVNLVKIKYINKINNKITTLMMA